jgi:PAS domain S-box-containing protein
MNILPKEATMSVPDLLRRLKQPAFSGYGAAVLFVAAALIITRLLQYQYHYEPLLVPYLIAIMLSAWFGGFTAGWLAVALSLLVFYSYFLGAGSALALDVQLPRFLLALLVAVLVMWFSAAQRSGREALRRSEFDLAEAQRIAQIGSWTIDVATNIVRGSEEVFRIYDVDRTPRDIGYETLQARVHPEDRDREAQVLAEAASRGKPFASEYRIVTRNGQLKHLRCMGYARKDPAGAVSSLFGTVQDITERKNAEGSLRASADRLQALSRRLVEVQESDRRDLSHELHDRVGQTLTALRINMEVIRTHLSERDDRLVSERNDDSLTLIESAFKAVEDVMCELRPPMIDDFGPVAALRWYAREFSARTGILAEIRAGEDWRCDPETELSLFRIAQEALNNVARHSQARHVAVELRLGDQNIVLDIVDDGVGFNPAGDRSERKGFGLVTMRERCEALGGIFEIVSGKGRGTRITVDVPRRS